MNIERLLELIHANPFVRFFILLPNGEKMRIPHQDYIWVHPDRRTVIAVGENGQTRYLNHQLILELNLKPSSLIPGAEFVTLSLSPNHIATPFFLSDGRFLLGERELSNVAQHGARSSTTQFRREAWRWSAAAPCCQTA